MKEPEELRATYDIHQRKPTKSTKNEQYHVNLLREKSSSHLITNINDCGNCSSPLEHANRKRIQQGNKTAIIPTTRTEEEKYQKKINTLHNRLEASERKYINAKHLSDAHERSYHEANIQQIESEKKTTEYERLLRRNKDRLKTLEDEMQIQSLTESCHKNRFEILNIEKQIREIMADSMLQAPINTSKRRQLRKFKERLVNLRSKQKGQSFMLDDLLKIRNMNEDMRTAANNNDIEKLKALMTVQGVSVNIPDKSGFSAFKYACGRGHLEVIKIMIHSADIDDDNYNNNPTPLLLATKNSHSSVVELLLQTGADKEAVDQVGRTALLIACANGNYRCVSLLLESGANINVIDKKGNNALHLCCSSCAGSDSGSSGYADVGRLLLDRGANTMHVNVDGFTPEEVAGRRKRDDLMGIFTEYKKNNVEH